MPYKSKRREWKWGPQSQTIRRRCSFSVFVGLSSSSIPPAVTTLAMRRIARAWCACARQSLDVKFHGGHVCCANARRFRLTQCVINCAALPEPRIRLLTHRRKKLSLIFIIDVYLKLSHRPYEKTIFTLQSNTRINFWTYYKKNNLVVKIFLDFVAFLISPV